MPTKDISAFGEHLIIGLSGPSLSEHDHRVLSTIKPMGILFLGRNFRFGVNYSTWLSEWKELHREIYSLTGRASMLMTLDHEGGHVHRAPLPITRFPYASQFGNYIEDIARAQATELKSLGINVSWAPVTDIHSNPTNPVIGVRAFGTTAEEVSKKAVRYLLTLQEEGVLGCMKHYPGHGDTSTDSHFVLPVVNSTKEELKKRELLPFKALSEAGALMAMTGHIQYPKVDSEPATLSKTFLIDILRKDLGFTGVTISDDIDMKAISDRFTREDGLSLALNAGCDAFILAQYPDADSDRPFILAERFAASLDSGAISFETVSEARKKVSTLLSKTKKYDITPLPPEAFEKNATLALSVAYDK